jgi:hypothetical protein
VTLEQEKIIIGDIILALLENRDFLGHQLSYAEGIITGKEIEIIEDTHFSKIGLESDEILLPKLKVLYRLIKNKIDGDVTSVALRCDYEQAERVLNQL